MGPRKRSGTSVCEAVQYTIQPYTSPVDLLRDSDIVVIPQKYNLVTIEMLKELLRDVSVQMF